MQNIKNILIILTAVLLTILAPYRQVFAATEPALENSDGLPREKAREIDKYMIQQMNAGNVPGASVVIVKDGNPVYMKGFGFADIKAKKAVTPKTLFELASNSKAFTALGILQLEKQGRIRFADSIRKYLPWFRVTFQGKDTDITLEQFLHHTSGIPFDTIKDIPVSAADNALEKTVKRLIGVQLDSYPGTQFTYATINYDVLGLVIAKVSGQPYEEYMKNNVLAGMGMNHTYLFRKDGADDLAKGYKIGFSKAIEYNASPYRGNTPAGYYISSGEELGKWLAIQLGEEAGGKVDREIINRSHVPGTVLVEGSLAYAGGWYVEHNDNGIIWHPGNNPNYSSAILIDKKDRLGIAVLGNLDSAFINDSARGIWEILKGEAQNQPTISDLYQNIDGVAAKAVYGLTPLLLLFLILFGAVLLQIRSRKRNFKGRGAKGYLILSVFCLLIAGNTFLIYIVPSAFFEGLTWSFLNVWLPVSLIIAAAELFGFLYLVCVYFLIQYFFPKISSVEANIVN